MKSVSENKILWHLVNLECWLWHLKTLGHNKITPRCCFKMKEEYQYCSPHSITKTMNSIKNEQHSLERKHNFVDKGKKEVYCRRPPEGDDTAELPCPHSSKVNTTFTNTAFNLSAKTEQSGTVK